MSKLVRVDEKTYKKLHQFAGRLQVRAGRNVDLDEAVLILLKGGAKIASKAPEKGVKAISRASEAKRARRTGVSRNWRVFSHDHNAFVPA